jgi:hypothetical protein
MIIQPLQSQPLATVLAGQGRIQGHEIQGGRGGTPVPRAPASQEARAAARAELLSADAPAGTDPMLWSVLTGEERAFFARARALGHVTYGPGASHPTAQAPRGGRVDVRV